MSIHKRFILGLMPALLLSVLPRVAAADELLGFVPEDALGVMVVNRLKESSDKFTKAAAAMNHPMPSPLDMFRMQVGIQAGLDANGSALLMMLPGESGWADAEPIVMLPVTDYREFVAQFQGDPDKEITEVKLAGKPTFVGQKGSYAVFSEKDKEALLRVLKVQPKLAPQMREAQPWIEKNDVALVTTTAGIKLATKTGAEELQKAIQQFENFPGLDDHTRRQMKESMELYRKLLLVLGDEIALAGIGARLEEGNVHIATRALFVPEGNFAKYGQQKDSPLPNAGATSDPLALLPKASYATVMAAQLASCSGKLMADWTVRMIRQNPGIYGIEKLSDEDADKLGQSVESAMQGLHSLAMVLSPGTGDEPLYSGMQMVMKVDSAEQYLDNYEQSLVTWNEVVGKANATGFDFKRAEVKGHKCLAMTMDLVGMMARSLPPGTGEEQKQAMREIMSRVVGPGGKFTICLAAVDATTVVLSYASLEAFEPVLESFLKKTETLATDAGLVETKKLLLENSQVTAYVSLGGMVKLVDRAIRLFAPSQVTLPEFPETAPAGMAARMESTGVETDLVVPAATLKSASAYFLKVKQQFGTL